MKNSKAFTLIELLVVMAGIILLASIIIVGLAAARDKAKDATITGMLSQVRDEAQMIWVESRAFNDPSNSLCAGNILNSGNTNHPMLAEIADRIMKYNGGTQATCYAETNDYCVSSPLNLLAGFCVDSNGQATSVKITCDGDPVPACE